jgi:uncharacterized membrane-anchored protein YhcB (DUF1043 family)
MDQNLFIVASVALAGGLIIGFLIGNLKSRGAGTRARDAEAELEAYRKHVTEHFGQTAAHFQALGQQYKSLYEHLAAGADSLCDTPDAGRELSFLPSGMLAHQSADLPGEAEVAEETAAADAAAPPAAASEAAAEEPDKASNAATTADAADAAGDDEMSAATAAAEPSDDAPTQPAVDDNAELPKVAAETRSSDDTRPLYH